VSTLGMPLTSTPQEVAARVQQLIDLNKQMFRETTNVYKKERLLLSHERLSSSLERINSAKP